MKKQKGHLELRMPVVGVIPAAPAPLALVEL
jgi:hypothetical protein